MSLTTMCLCCSMLSPPKDQACLLTEPVSTWKRNLLLACAIYGYQPKHFDDMHPLRKHKAMRIYIFFNKSTSLQFMYLITKKMNPSFSELG